MTVLKRPEFISKLAFIWKPLIFLSLGFNLKASLDTAALATTRDARMEMIADEVTAFGEK
ncbi:MAG: hypothetical protein DRH11_14655 [Deltaproteobacteria bacterium]|nr:hypothetical protein [Deltaproteobacteria bacterium]MBW1930684.1 hypothetical protein [Deltaproteobacteria bacterium]MBW2026661.1 hypothetical protein [Deltaproteobacteria bacterium]MBW2126693.1 hypothetical protein [Deltaproteobacteria bacterium]RLB30549.1 MAG: hypothetical protein DRH11_14655 [Deltaproteobacteria bacterium]